MLVKIENDKIILYDKWIDNDGKMQDFYAVVIDAWDFAKLLKPYLDSIPNCECGSGK